MSFPQLTFVPKRCYHHSANYLALWNRCGINYQKVMGAARPHMHESPRVVQQVLRTEETMKKRGYTPFVHATPAATNLLRKFYEVIYGKDQEFFAYLRPPSASYKKPMLSLSYALTSGVKPFESAASWGFVNHGGNYPYFDLVNAYKDILQKMGERAKAFEEKGFSLIRRYNRLQVGDFLVLGLPQRRVDLFVFDSKPFNFPTGKKASSVAAHPERYTKALQTEETHMATMQLCHSLLNPASDLMVVNCNHPAEVDKFCGAATSKSINTLGLASPVDTDFEKDQMEKRKKIDAELQTLTDQFAKFLKTGNFDPPIMTEEDRTEAGDFPPSMP